MLDLTTTAQVINDAQAIIQGAKVAASASNWGHVALAGILGVASAPVGQAIIEHWTAGPKMPAKIKALAPLLLALGVSYLSTRFGVTPEQAATAGALFAGATHVWNETPLAANVDAPK